MEPLQHDRFLEHERFLRALARRLAGDEHEADDLTQDVWAYALSRPPRHGRNPRAWLARVMRSVFVDRRRRLQAKIHHEALIELEASRERSSASRSEISPEVRRALAEALDGLRPIYRDAVVLRHAEGLGIGEIAARLGVPAETVRTRLKRGLEQLRRRLDADHDGGRRWQQALAALPGLGRRARLATSSRMPMRWAWILGGLMTSMIGMAWIAWPDQLQASPLLVRAAGRGSDSPAPAVVAVDRADRASAESEDAHGVLGIRTVWADDGTPAAGTRILIEGPRSLDGRQDLATDHGGRLVLADLQPGSWSVQADHGRQRVGVVRPSERTELELRLPRGERVSGRVVTHRGRPVKKASVWLSWPDRPDVGRTVAVTDAEGRFTLDDVDRRCWLGARKGGVDARLTYLDVPALSPDAPVEIELRRFFPCTVTCTVLDAAGSAIEGATIEVWSGNPLQTNMGIDGLVRALPGPRRLTADARGELHWKRLPRSRIRFVASAEGFEPESRSVDLRQVREHRLELRLHRTPDTGSARRAERARAVGAFGSSEAFVFDLRRWSQRGPVCGSAVEGSGDPAARGPITGCLLDESGRPAAGWLVALDPERDEPTQVAEFVRPIRSERYVRSRPDGSFAFEGCAAADHRLQVFEPDDLDDPGAGIPHSLRFGLRPGTHEIVFLSAASHGVVRGTFLDSRGERIAGGELLVSGPALAQVQRRTLTEGSFTLGGLPPATYRLGLWAPGRAPVFDLWEVSLASAEDRDVGTWRLPVPASLLVTAEGPSLWAARKARLTLRSSQGLSELRGPRVPGADSDSTRREGCFFVEDIPPGSYTIRVSSPGFTPFETTVSLGEGAHEQVSVWLEP